MNEKTILQVKEKWLKLKSFIKEQFEMDPDLQSILFLIGVQELGGIYREYSKQEKMELIHVGTCAALALFSYYELIEKDKEGWPHYQLVKSIPAASIAQQNLLLKEAIILYFENQGIME